MIAAPCRPLHRCLQPLHELHQVLYFPERVDALVIGEDSVNDRNNFRHT
jgi:hypothetical protein